MATFYFLVLSIIFLPHPTTCEIITCSGFCKEDGPEIRFPFRLKNQPTYCGYQGFEIECKDGETIINLPPAGEMQVFSIFYGAQTLFIKHPWKCAAEFFIDFNNRTSPFQVTPRNDHAIFNCSKKFYSLDFIPINCLSNYQFYLYAVPASLNLGELPAFCTRTVALPMKSYDDDGVIELTWNEPHCGLCEDNGGTCGFWDSNPLDLQCFIEEKTHGAVATAFAYDVAAGVFIVSILLSTTLICCIRWKPNRNDDTFVLLKVEEFLENYKSMKPMRYSYADIRRMTQNFKDKLGEGGFGSVYKGILPNGCLAAVKILKGSTDKDGEEFINEVVTIGRIHHINIVRLLGFCAEGPKRALIYEFVANESLEKYISKKDGNDPILGWEKLQKIAVGIAKGMEYLHQGCDQRILHFDIKPHSILLDQNYNPKISDFGLAKLCSRDQSRVSMTSVRGTMGYMAPEVVSMNFGNVSHKSDVYSFGILLLEMVRGRKNIQSSEMVGGGKNIQSSSVEVLGEPQFEEWIYDFPHHAEELGARIMADGDAMIAKKLTIVAFWCIQWHPADRPPMETVVQMLERDVDSLTMPINPFSFTAPPTENDTQRTEEQRLSSEK